MVAAQWLSTRLVTERLCVQILLGAVLFLFSSLSYLKCEEWICYMNASVYKLEMSCTRLGPLKDALPTELQRQG